MYEDKSAAYFSICRTDILKFVPAKRDNRILEIGAGSGDTLLEAKQNGLAGYVAGVDLTEVKDSNQTHPAIDRFIIGNIESLELDFEDNFFDVILCGDVLEHLIDPWKCLGRLRHLLRDGGVIIASIPNVRYWKISMGLLFGGRWPYADAGILDRTHLRFFVKQTVHDLFTETGFTVNTVESQGPQRKWGGAAWVLNKLTMGMLTDMLTFQFVIMAEKHPQTRLLDLRP